VTGVTDLFARLHEPAEEAAPLLLNAVITDGEVAVRLVEVEAYSGERDPASHAFRGPGVKNAVMFGPPGRAYVYLSYGMHYCLNVVCHPEGIGGGILLRAGEVVAGVDEARRRRNGHRDLARGPGRLGQVLAVTPADSGENLRHGRLRLEPGPPAADIARGPRVGVSKAWEVDWRFWIPGDPYVSPYRRSPRATSPERP
jgi:DNA-3-methyladenine glycosylase